MAASAQTTWLEMNQRYLTAGIAYICALLERHSARATDTEPDDRAIDAAREEMAAIAAAMSAPPALERIRVTFGLSAFERDVLLLCAAVECNARVGTLCASAQGDSQRVNPTFSLALAALSNAHWSALTPGAPLRRARLIDVGSGQTFVLSPLRIEERVLHSLTGVQYLDTRLTPYLDTLAAGGMVLPSHQEIARRLAESWLHARTEARFPCVHLTGMDATSKREIVAAACRDLGINCSVLIADMIPSASPDLDLLIQVWDREVALSAHALFLDCEDIDLNDPTRISSVTRLIERVRGPLVIASRESWHARNRPFVTFEVGRPGVDEQGAAWQAALGDAAAQLNGRVGALVSQFNLSPIAIQAVSDRVRPYLADRDPTALGELLWETCRTEARTHLDNLAERIESPATWDDLVLPEAQRDILHEIAVHVRQRAKVYHTWGFAGKGSRGLGISALFAGASGTGKTMAAEVLANELRLDLYRIDLSAVVSKYIGETEKNLRRVFDAAEAGGAILLFDEADALFGKRSEVKDSHDRYANIEVGYLLQRMEAYRGLAILTTNLKNSLDTAFLRRIRFVVQFPFPDAAQRAEIWRRIFPAATPQASLQIESLARLNVAGGNIRNIALHAAFLAAEANEPVRMTHVLSGARTEYAKLEKPLTEAEIGDWERGGT